jgi:hypothetical protein
MKYVKMSDFDYDLLKKIVILYSEKWSLSEEIRLEVFDSLYYHPFLIFDTEETKKANIILDILPTIFVQYDDNMNKLVEKLFV